MDEIIKLVKQKVLEVISDDPEHISDNEQFRNIGIDSIDYVSLVMEIEEHYGISLIEEDIPWHTINTIYKLSEVVHERIR